MLSYLKHKSTAVERRVDVLKFLQECCTLAKQNGSTIIVQNVSTLETFLAKLIIDHSFRNLFTHSWWVLDFLGTVHVKIAY